MDANSENNTFEDVSLPNMQSAPPPPPEVKIRTMRSDLESIMKNGGGLPHFQSIRVSGLSMDHGVHTPDGLGKDKKNAIMTVLTVIAILVILGLVGYLWYKKYI